ncbi:MAG: DNA repair protein RadA [Nitrospirae bacterium]|nr:DNA repair protein RadA [Nitrospirota bacterium]
MKPKTIFACQTCGHQSPKWLGRCPDCGQWNSLVEERIVPTTTSSRRGTGGSERPISLLEVTSSQVDRASTGMEELDRVLGGGVVPGSLILIGGDPGIGKSTLVLQAVSVISRVHGPVLYVSGEESPQQIRLRADRLGVLAPDLLLLAETSLPEITKALGEVRPRLLVIDSIQTIFTPEISSAPGSISQVREVAGQLMVHAKRHHLPVFLVGHVTKDGAIAGPRVLEHIVDTVLYFEGEKGQPFRILRAVKNRFGSTNEIGVFEMKTAGLQEVVNPSEIFMAERPLDVPGSVVVSSLEGTRPLLVELQALVSPTVFGMPRRTAIGVDPNRVSLLLAILEKRAGLRLTGQDVYVNVVGGITIEEPAVDLGVCLAVASSHREIPIDSRTLVFGEVGLAGEIRAVSQAEVRVKEAAKLGFSRCVLPERCQSPALSAYPIEILGVATVGEALEAVLQ